jgi:SAM-dependent methyltransferase
MESFGADWLALREPADHAARSDDLTREVSRRSSGHRVTRAVDLAAGTGSNVRYLRPRLPHITGWALVDGDATLLEVARRQLEPLAARHGVRIETRQLDLADIEALPLDGCALVTASAWLDLVTEPWMGRFERRCRAASVDVLCALTYDGRLTCDPADPYDARVRALVNAHQRTDKGLGPALGPDAVTAFQDAFRGWEVRVETSDWRLGADQAELQRQLLAGWADAAREMAPGEAALIDAWHRQRCAYVAEGRLRIIVGHHDMAAWVRQRWV